MYQIKQGDYVLYDLRDEDLILENPELNLEINKVGSLSFSIYPNHPHFDKLTKLTSKLTVLKDGAVIFMGRMISDEQGLYNNKKVECEGVLGYLNDSIVRPYSFSGTPEEHFKNLFNNHNEQVTDGQKLKIGIITVTDPNDYIVRSSIDYKSTWDILNEDLINKLGGFLRVRYESDGVYVDYLEDFEDTSTQVIEFGENLIDVLVKNDAMDVYTAVIPLGAEIEAEDGTSERLTIKSVNNGLDYLINQEAFNKYGFIAAPVEETTWDDVTVASNLLTKGTIFLNNDAIMLKSSLELSATDLSLVDKDIENFFIYEYIRFKSKVHNIDERYLLTKITIPLSSPENMKINLGKEESSLTGIEITNKNSINNAINRVGKIEKNYSIDSGKINEIREELQVNITSIQQSQDEILMTALGDYTSKSEFESYQNQISTQFQQTSENFEFNINNVTSQINQLDGDTQQKFQELNTYFRITENGTELGKSDSDIILKQQNDRISFIQNNTEVAYISNSTLYITDARFLVSIVIGNFAFKPRANGNLSLIYVGGE